MTQIYAALQQLALRHGIAIVVVDHHRKSARNVAESDPIDDIFGSTAKASVVDCAIGLYRKHNSPDAILKLVGRDFGDAEYALTWDPESFTWHRKDEGQAGAKDAQGNPPAVNPRPQARRRDPRGARRPGSQQPGRAGRRSSRSTSATCSTSLLAMVDAGLLRRTTEGGSVTYSPAPAPRRHPARAAQLVLRPRRRAGHTEALRTRAYHVVPRIPRLPRVPRIPRIPRIPRAPAAPTRPNPPKPPRPKRKKR